MNAPTTAKLIAAASLALGSITLVGCHSSSDKYDEHQQGTYRSGDDNYRPAEHRMDSYNSGSGGTGTGSPMGDAVGRYPSGSPSLGTAGATSGGGIGVSNGSSPPNTAATPAGAGVSGTVTIDPNAATTGDVSNVPGRDRPTDATMRRTAPEEARRPGPLPPGGTAGSGSTIGGTGAVGGTG